MPLNIDRTIDRIKAIPEIGPLLADGLVRLQDGVNQVGTNLGGDTQPLPPPPTIQGVSVKADGNGNVHAVVQDNNPIQKGIHYFVEYQQLKTADPLVFKQPHVVHLGTSRTMHPIALPAQDDSGNNVHYIFRAYSSYPGGESGDSVHFGGDRPTPVLPGGTGRMTMLSSTGSGTGQPSGQEGGVGFGKVLFRGKQGPKRRAK